MLGGDTFTPPATAPAPAAFPARAETRAIGQLIVCLGRLPEFSAYPAQQDYASRKCQGGPSARKERGGLRRLPPLLLRQGGGGGRLPFSWAAVISLPRYYADFVTFYNEEFVLEWQNIFFYISLPMLLDL